MSQQNKKNNGIESEISKRRKSNGRNSNDTESEDVNSIRELLDRFSIKDDVNPLEDKMEKLCNMLILASAKKVIANKKIENEYIDPVDNSIPLNKVINWNAISDVC